MGVWTKSRLGDICRFKYGEMPKKSDLQGTGYPVFSGYRLVGFSSRFHYKDSEIIVVARGVGGTGDIKMTPEKCFLTNLSIAILLDSPKLIKKFLYYKLFSTTLWELRTGSAQAQITIEHLNKHEVEYPELDIQKKIVSIFDAYDDLIENCQRRIKILEGMARAIYREWFVNFRYPGHEAVPLVDSPLGPIPQGWEVRLLKDIATVTYGFPFQSKKFTTEQVGTPVVRIRDILEGAVNTFTDEEALSKYHIKNGDILVGMDGDFHMCIWSNGHAYQNQRVAKFESKGDIGNFHLFMALEKPIQTWNKSIVGTTVAHLGDMHIKAIQIIWPSTSVLKKASDMLEPLSEQIISLKQRIYNLRRTRDLLLPRLLSGQIDLSKDEPLEADAA